MLTEPMERASINRFHFLKQTQSKNSNSFGEASEGASIANSIRTGPIVHFEFSLMRKREEKKGR